MQCLHQKDKFSNQTHVHKFVRINLLYRLNQSDEYIMQNYVWRIKTLFPNLTSFHVSKQNISKKQNFLEIFTQLSFSKTTLYSKVCIFILTVSSQANKNEGNCTDKC